MLLVDTANEDDIRRFLQTDAVSGVTTNPSLVAKEAGGMSYRDKMLRIAGLFPKEKGYGVTAIRKHLSVEVITLDDEEMVRQAESLNSDIRNMGRIIDLYIKVPANRLSVITALERVDIRVNATAIAVYPQAMLADRAGASFVSFFWRRAIDAGEDVASEVKKFSQRGSASIICGSIRTPSDVIKAWDAGANYVTASPKIIGELSSHKVTGDSIAGFMEDIKRWQK